MADGSPTSGGTGDQVLTIDTFTDTLTGTSGVKIAVGGLRKVVLGRDLGDIAPTNELDVQDARGNAIAIRETLSLRSALEALLGRLESALTTVQRPARSARTSGVTASTSSVTICDVAVGRIAVMVYNDATSSGNLYLSFGVDPAANGKGTAAVRLVPGAYYEVPAALTEMPITGIWDSATSGFCDVTEAY